MEFIFRFSSLKHIVKKTILLMMFFIFFSCETDDSSLKISISSIPPQIVKLHVAVLGGSTIISQKSVFVDKLDSNGSVELNVPSGNDREIVIWAENDSGFAEYFGSKPVNISGIKMPVSVAMQTFAAGFNVSEGVLGSNVISWNVIPGLNFYELENDSVFDENFILRYSGQNNYFDMGTYVQANIRVRSYSSIFKIYSEYSNYFSY